MPSSDEEARLTQALADLLYRHGIQSIRDYYPMVPSGAVYRISVVLWQDAPPERPSNGGTLTAWEKK